MGRREVAKAIRNVQNLGLDLVSAIGDTNVHGIPTIFLAERATDYCYESGGAQNRDAEVNPSLKVLDKGVSLIYLKTWGAGRNETIAIGYKDDLRLDPVDELADGEVGLVEAILRFFRTEKVTHDLEDRAEESDEHLALLRVVLFGEVDSEVRDVSFDLGMWKMLKEMRERM